MYHSENHYSFSQFLHTITLMLLSAVFITSCLSEADTDGSGSDSCPEGERMMNGECASINGSGIDRDGGTTDGQLDDYAVVDLDGECVPGIQVCIDASTIAVCQADGTYLQIVCGSDQICQGGDCIDLTGCTPGAYLGCADDSSYYLCADNGEDWDQVFCPPETPNCVPGIEGCTTMICFPGQSRCNPDSPNEIQICADDGNSWQDNGECIGGETCEDGICISACEENAKIPSFLGCDYWALDLDNIEEPCLLGICLNPGTTCNPVNNICEPSAASQQFSVSISNPNTEEVIVTVTNFATMAETTYSVGAETVDSLPLDRNDVNGTGVTSNAFHITSTLPVTAHQFNPSNNVGVFSNDASLLLPSNAGGLSYVVLGWPSGPFGASDVAHAYTSIVAVSENSTTTVTITPTATIQGSGSISSMPSGTPSSVDLSYGQVLNLETMDQANLDLSGTIIESNHPILVFSGHECAFIPDELPTPYCDHIEQQIFPVEAWGNTYIAAKLSPRGTEVDVYRVVASEDGTTLTTDPAIGGVSGQTINRGEVIEFETRESFQMTGTAPILLGQFMTGSNYPGIPFTCSGGLTGMGDPAFMLAVPSSQYRDNYIFLTPADYLEDWFTAVVPDGTSLTLDGVALSSASYAPIGASGYSVYHHNTSSTGSLDDAQAHTLSGTAPFSLSVYGYDCDVSYAYPGGLNLTMGEE